MMCVHCSWHKNECNIMVNKVRLSARTLRSSNGLQSKRKTAKYMREFEENMCAESKTVTTHSHIQNSSFVWRYSLDFITYCLA